MIGYILLITTSIIISGIVYQWAKTYVPAEAVECPEGVSVFVKESIYICEDNQLNLVIKNNGRFNIGGYLIRATISPTQTLASEDLSHYTYSGETGAVLLPTLDNSMKPNDEMIRTFNFNATSFDKIYSIEIIPVLFQDKKIINCADARIKEKLNCFVAACVPEPIETSCGIQECSDAVNNCGDLIECGICASDSFCDSSGQCILNACTPAVDPSFVALCGTDQCGDSVNGSCGTISCGTCGVGLSCNTTGQCVSVCGDSTVGGIEECDDGNTNNNDNCIIDSNSSYECLNALCGDGYIWNQGAGTEQCDDNNLIDGDGCSSICQIEAGWICTGEPSSCVIDSTVVDCSDYCAIFTGFTGGGCQQNPNQCTDTYIGNIPGANETFGNSFCTTGNSDTCCCTSL